MHRRQFTCGAAAGALTFWSSCAGAGPQVSFAFDQDAFPTQYSLQTGASVGVYPGIVAELCRVAQISALNVAAPFKRVVAQYLAGTVAGGALIETPERIAAGTYSRPYYVERLRPYFARKTLAPVRSVADLKGMRVGVIRGWAYGQEFDEARRAGLFQAEDVATGYQNFIKLHRGRLDCVVATELAAALFSPTFKDLEVVPGEFLLLQAPIHLAIPKKHEQADALISRIDKAIGVLTRSNALQEIVDRELRTAAEHLPIWQHEHHLD